MAQIELTTAKFDPCTVEFAVGLKRSQEFVGGVLAVGLAHFLRSDDVE